MKHTWFLLSSWGLCLLLGFGSTASLPAQTVLERLENQIRQRTAQVPGQDNPPPQPIPPPAPQVAEDRPAPGYLGVTADDRRDRGRGVRILDVYAGSPAEKAGLHKQDLITGVGDLQIRHIDALADVLELYAPGESVEFTLMRGNAPVKIRVTMGAPPQKTPDTPNPPELIPPPAAQAPPGQPLLLPPEPRTADKPPALPGKQPPGPMDLILPPPQNPPSTVEAKIEGLQRRMFDLEKRIHQLERELAELKKKAS